MLPQKSVIALKKCKWWCSSC